MSIEVVIAGVVGMVIGALLTEISYRVWIRQLRAWLKNLIDSHLDETILEAEKFYEAEGISPTRPERLIWNTYRILVDGLKYPQHLHVRLSDAFFDLSYFLRSELRFRRYGHLKEKARLQLEELRTKLPDDDHLLRTAQYYMERTSCGFSPALVDQVILLIKEIERGLDDRQRAAILRERPPAPSDS